MDPLASVKEFRTQSAGPGRTLTVAPPPPVPVPAPAAPQPETVAVDDPDPTGELEFAAPEADGEPDDLPGMARGRKRLINAYLPGATRQRLDDARAEHGTLGTAVMAALRGSYQWLVEHHTPAPVEAVGPFPAPRAPRRRLAVEDARLRPFYVHPDEAKAIDQLADQLELSVSELVTLAVDNHYGEGGSLPVGPAPRHRRTR